MCCETELDVDGAGLAGEADRNAEMVEAGLDVTEPDEVDAEDVEESGLAVVRAGGPERRDRLLAQLARLAVVAGRHQRRREPADDPRPLDGRRFGRDQGDGGGVLRERRLAVAGGPEVVGELRVEEPRGDGLGRLVDLGERGSPELDGPGPLAGVVRGLGGEPEQLEPGHAGRVLGVRDAVRQVDCPLRLAQRVGMGVDGGRGARRGDRGDQGFAEAPGGVPVVGELARRPAQLAIRPGRCLPRRDFLVEPPSLARQQLVGDDLREQGVAESVAWPSARRRRGPAGRSPRAPPLRAPRAARPVVSARSSSSASWPATAAIPSTRRASVERPARRPRRMSRSDRGSRSASGFGISDLEGGRQLLGEEGIAL